jgi:hypothetical protein
MPQLDCKHALFDARRLDSEMRMFQQPIFERNLFNHRRSQ